MPPQGARKEPARTVRRTRSDGATLYSRRSTVRRWAIAARTARAGGRRQSAPARRPAWYRRDGALSTSATPTRDRSTVRSARRTGIRRTAVAFSLRTAVLPRSAPRARRIKPLSVLRRCVVRRVRNVSRRPDAHIFDQRRGLARKDVR